jgi:hypothetical protein
MARIKMVRAEQEKKWQSGDGRLMRDFSSLKDLYAVRFPRSSFAPRHPVTCPSILPS